MRLRAVLAAAVVVLAVAPAPSAGAATPKKRCTAAGAKTVVKNRVARVFSAPYGEGEFTTARLFGCLYSNGRRVLLDQAEDDEYVSSEEFRKVRLNGRFAAWEHESFDISCKADCPPGYQASTTTVHARDLRARRNRSFDGSVSGQSLVVGARGTPAWLQAAGDRVEVRAGGDVLDSGAIDSLRLRGTTLSWRNAGLAKSAELD